MSGGEPEAARKAASAATQHQRLPLRVAIRVDDAVRIHLVTHREPFRDRRIIVRIDPAIVLRGADLDRASSAILWGGTANAGQSCLSIERVYVDESVHDEFVDLLVAKAERTALAHPEPEDGPIGPLIDPEQATVIDRHLTEARERGAVVRTGGTVERLDGGHWVRPTVLTGVDHSMTVMTEETFGPVIPVMACRDTAEAVALANDSSYGLSAAVFGPDPETAGKVARQLNVGAVSINDAALTAFVHDGEKNSHGFSGLGGSRMGDSALTRFVRRQTLIVNRATTPDPWWATPTTPEEKRGTHGNP